MATVPREATAPMELSVPTVVTEAFEELPIVTASFEELPVVTASLAPVVTEIPTYSKLYWGPLVWRLFHTLAEISNRRDVLGIWNMVLAATAECMPCAQCRMHFGSHLRTHPMTFVKRSILITGPQARDKIRNELWSFHNIVNKRTGKEEKSIDILFEQYGAKTRNELLLEAQNLANELKKLWEPHVHKQIKAKAFHDWKRTLQLLITVLRSGPT
jgi:hypothetical protein